MASEAAQRRRAAYHHRLYGDCCGVDSRDDYGDVVGHRVPAGRATSCTSDSDSTCRRPTSAAMTSVSSDLNCGMKDLLKLDILSFPCTSIKISRIIALMIPERYEDSRE